MTKHPIIPSDVETMPAADVNHAIGTIIGAVPLNDFFMTREGEKLWRIGCVESEVEGRRLCLAELQTSDSKFAGFAIQNGLRLDDRGKLTIENFPRHLRYSDTPGGGWIVIEAIKSKGFAIQIKSGPDGWSVICGATPKRNYFFADTMAKAACKAATRILNQGD